MRVESVELRIVEMPLLRPFETSFGRQHLKRCMTVRMDAEGVTGWGECVAMEGPFYSEEYVGTAWLILTEFLIPQIIGKRLESANELTHLCSRIRGNYMAKAALENAFLDAQSRARAVSLSSLLGGTRDRIESGVSIGIHEHADDLLRTIHRELKAGYKRIKLKVKPGKDIEVVRAVRREFPDTPLMVDANSAYSLSDATRLAHLDEFDLMMVEQPLGNDDIIDHSILASRIRTPICLDESIHTVEHARQALDIGACAIINIKTGRLGGHMGSVATHDLCRSRGVPVWCGGMLETNIGRAHNVALASLPGFTLPGDVAASDRYFETDLAFPNFEVASDGTLTVPTGPGIGVEVDARRLKEVTLRREEFRA